MTAGLIAALLIAVAGAAFVAAPLLGRERSGPVGAEVLSEARELQSRRDMLLASLKDLEDDWRSDRVEDADYQQIRARLSEEAVSVMRRLDELQARQEELVQRENPVLTYPGPRRTGHNG